MCAKGQWPHLKSTKVIADSADVQAVDRDDDRTQSLAGEGICYHTAERSPFTLPHQPAHRYVKQSSGHEYAQSAASTHA
jgi:hypothetical protein